MLKLKKGDLRAPVHRLEIQRIKFMVNSYLRLRLFKIQKNVFHVTKTSDDNPSRMTPEEAEFAGNYRQMIQEHRYKREFWDHQLKNVLLKGERLKHLFYLLNFLEIFGFG